MNQTINNTKEVVMHRSTEGPAVSWLRAGLILLALVSLIIGCWALFFPQNFYADFPLPGHNWVAMLPPYNEHLVRDVGEFNLCFVLLFGWAAVSLERRLVQIVLIASLVYAVPHFIFHLTHLMPFPLIDQVLQTITLALVIVLPLALLIVLRYAKSLE